MMPKTPLFATLLVLSTLAWPAPAAAQPRDTSKPVAFKVDERPGEIRLVTDAYTFVVTREGFGWTLLRGTEPLLRSAQPDNATPNGVLLFETTPEKPGAIKKVDKAPDRVVLEYAFTRAKTGMLVELVPLSDRVRVTTVGLHRDPPLHSLGSALRFELGAASVARWYGGGFQGWRGKLVLPLNDARIETPGFVAFGKTQASPFWYSTAGAAVWVRTPLDFRYSVNRAQPQAGTATGKPDGLVSVEMPAATLTYDVLVAADVREVVRTFIREVGYPAVTPPADYFRLPIYTTWVEHKVPVDQAKVLEYARAIKKNNLPAGIIEIDDKWEAKYGDMEFDATKFPDPKSMIAEIHKLGMKVTLWVHPFVNIDSETYARIRKEKPGSSEGRKLLRDGVGNIGLFNWWNGNAALWDMSYAPAAAEFRAKLKRLQSRYGIDGFKFDGGDSEMVPQEARANDGKDPIEYSDVYNREATAKWPLNETRVGIYSQRLGIVQRLIDKHSIWGPENGLAALVPEMIIVSLRGYPYAMPDMIGGNQYNDDRADKELMIRWAQASALMPLIQFSIGPWHFDDETVRLSREASELHIKAAPLIIDLAKQAPKTGEPILAPLWYHHPKDAATFAITDQFMIGTDVVVAPVVVKGAVARDVYLPAGKWRDLTSGAVSDGGRLLKAHPAPLTVLPVFLREGSKADQLLGKR